MLPDVHFEKGLKCLSCHNMKSFSYGEKYSKDCNNCHRKISNIMEHNIKAHKTKILCSGCHSAWSQNELGTYYIKIEDMRKKDDYNSIINISRDYRKTSYIKNNFETFLGINEEGKYATIRPYFISFFSKVADKVSTYFVSADWRVKYSHTIRRETILCQQCHENSKKFILMENDLDIFDLGKDGIPLESFYNSKGNKILNGKFVDKGIWEKISSNGEDYRKYFILKQLQLIEVIKNAK